MVSVLFMRLTKIESLYNLLVMKQSGYTKNTPDLDVIFSALADTTRREILKRLSDGEASVNELAAPFNMSQPAISKHLKVLEKAGLIERNIDKQRRPARLNADNMALAVSWLEEFKHFWGTRFDQLDDVLETLKMEENNE